MDIWIIQNGEKVGPIHDFEVRKKIEAGELPANTPAWHDGLAAWRPLAEISLFESEFDRPFEPPNPSSAVPVPAPQPPMPPPLPGQAYLLRRFWARWFDLFLYDGLWWIAMWAAGRDIGATLNNLWIMLFHYIPWFALEAFLLHRFGTTPGKWLLGIKVTNNNGSLLSLADSTQRSARVLFIGIGFGWGPIALICQTIAWFTTRRIGRSLWDQAGGHRIGAGSLNPTGLAAYVLLFFAFVQLQVIVVAPYAAEAAGKTFPALKEQFEKNPPWHLPKRS